MIFLRRNIHSLPHGFPSLSKTVQLIRTVRQVSPHGDSFTPSGWPCDWTTRRHADPCLGQSSDRWRAFTLPINQLERKKNTAVCRHPQTHSFWGLAGLLLSFAHYNVA